MTSNVKMKFLNPPYNLFLLTALILFIISFFMWGQSLDLHLHDTYFVISTIYFIWAFALIFLVVWTIYKLTNKILLTKYLTWLHVVTTLIVLILLMTAGLWFDKLLPPIKREVVSYQTFLDDQQRELKVILPIAIIFIVGQVSWGINLIGGLIKRVL